jgi:transcriptional regulator with XRE-family HTH domain
MTLPDAQVGPPPENGGWERIVESIGPKIRQIRQQLGFSLQQLAARSEVSAAAIHKVERGDMVPTITTLLKLSAALGRPIAYFVDDTGRVAPVAVHMRAGSRPPAPPGWAGSAQEVNSASIGVPDDRLRGGAVRAVVAPGGSSGGAIPPRAGEELLLVESGRLSFEVAGERYQLDAGDTVHYPTDRNHSWHNPGGEAATIICWYLRG